MTVYTKRAVDVFAPTESQGAARRPDNGEAQVWGTEIETVIAAKAEAVDLTAEAATRAAADTALSIRLEPIETGFNTLQSSVSQQLGDFSAEIDGLQSYILTNAKGYDTKANLDADLVPGAGTIAFVYNDIPNEGYYVKVGATTTGSWAGPVGSTEMRRLAAIQAAIEPAMDLISFDRIPQNQFVRSYGRVLGARAVASTFIGWRGTYPYNNESFDGVWMYLVLEADTSSVKLAIYADSSTVELASCTRLCRGSGWHFFKLNTRLVGADISTSYVRVGAWVTDASGRMSIGRTRNTVASSGANDQAYMTSVAVGTWTTTSSAFFRPAVRLVDTLDIRYDVTAAESAASSAIIDVDKVTAASITHVTALSDFNAFINGSTIHGYSTAISKPVSFSANGIYIPHLRRAGSLADANKWRKLVFVLRDGSTTGNVIASGEILVDPETEELNDVYIPFTDEFGAVVSVTQAAFSGTEIYLQLEATSLTGAPAYFGAPLGVIDIAYAQNNFMSSGSDSWTNATGVTYAFDLISATFTQARERVLRGTQFESTKMPSIALPPTLYSEVGVSANIYLDNIVRRAGSDYLWKMTATEGRLREREFSNTPAGTGDQTLTFFVHDKVSGRQLGSKAVTQKRIAANAKSGQTRTVLFVGDSLTTGTPDNVTPTSRIVTKAAAGGVTLTLIGSDGSGSDRYQGFPGQTLSYVYTNAASPFVNGGSFDFPNYLSVGGWATPDWVFFRLGTNDVNNSGSNNGGGFVAEANAIIYRAIAAHIRGTYASTKIGVILPPLPAPDQDGFGAPAVPTAQIARWFFKWKMHDYVQGLIDRLGGLTAEGIYLVPEHQAIDTLTGFPRAAPAPAHSGIVVTGTFATYAAMMANLTPANGLIYYVTDVANYFVKVGATTVGTWRVATEIDGIVRRVNNNVHPATAGYYQMADAEWAFMLAEL